MTKIQLAEVFGNNIFTRRIISSFFDELDKSHNKRIELDFSGIDFISRSCADEYLKRKKNSGKKIMEINMSNNVCSMFNVVKSQYKKAGFTISFDMCQSSNRKTIPA